MNAQKLKLILREKILTPSNLIVLLSFSIPMLLLHLVFHRLGMDGSGDKSLLIMDLKGQYLEFFASLRYIGKEGNSIFLSWSRSMGGNFIGLFAYYIASPLSFLTLFFPVERLCDAIYMLTLLKTGLCGLTFAIFLESAFNQRKGKWSVIAFSVSYALMSYTLVYGMCLMWLDGVILLPLVLLGIEKLLQGKKGLLYLCSIAALFICNYYTAYMVGVFSALYLIYRVISTVSKGCVKQTLVVVLRFALNTVFAFGISMPLVLPVVKDLMSGKLAQQSYMPTDIVYNFEFMDVFAKLKAGVYDSITNIDALPSIFCGSLTLLFAILFFFQKKYNIREKIGAILMLTFLLCSFWIFKLDVAWHGFQYPNWFPYRYAFVFSAFLVFLAYRGFNGISIRKKAVSYAVAAVCLVIAGVEMYYNGVGVLTGLDQQFYYAHKNEYTDFVEKTMPLVEKAKARDQGFYRMEKDFEFSKNDAMLLGYHGMTHYSSTFNSYVNQFTAKMGIAQSWLWNSGYGSTILTDSLFHVKYKMMEKNVPSAYEKIDEINGVGLYENKNALSIGFMADASSLDQESELNGDACANQNVFMQCLTGAKTQYFSALDYEKNNNASGFTMTFTADSNNPIYLHMNGGSGWGTIYVNDAYVNNYFSTETTCNVFVGEFLQGETVVIRVESDQPSYSEVIYALDMDAFERDIAKLRKGALDVQSYRNGKLTGKITAQENQVLFTSIPYDQGFTVKIDGKTTPLYKFMDTFLMVKAPAGEHTVEISYVSPGFFTGIVVAFFTIAVSLVYYNLEKVNRFFLRRKERDRNERD